MSFEVEISGLKGTDEEIDQSLPDFAQVRPDFKSIESAVNPEDYSNIILIGNGGSVTSFRALYYSFIAETDKNARIVTTMEPDFLHRVSRDMPPESTLVIPVSKSGSTVGVIEALMYFMDRDYDVLPLTSDNNGALREIVRIENLGFVEHRDVGGRFSGLTETGLFPAHVAGMDSREIRKGAEDMYEELEEEDNKAYRVAAALRDAQDRGYSEVLNAIYSTRLYGFKPLLVQLVHETACKDGGGMTVFGDLGPEFQHHTNQRLFGGKKDVVPFFFRSEANETRKINVSEKYRDTDIRGRKLGELDGKDLSNSLKSEYIGVKQALRDENMPYITLTLEELSHRSIGRLMAFIQITAVYFARFQGVDPFTQPDVEKSKNKGFEARFK